MRRTLISSWPLISNYQPGGRSSSRALYPWPPSDWTSYGEIWGDMGRYVQRTRGRLRTARAPIHSFRCEEMLFTGVPVAAFGLDEHVGGGEVRVRGEEGEGVAQPDDVEVALQHLLHCCGVCVIRASSRPGRAPIWGSACVAEITSAWSRLVAVAVRPVPRAAAPSSPARGGVSSTYLPISPHISPYLPTE